MKKLLLRSHGTATRAVLALKSHTVWLGSQRRARARLRSRLTAKNYTVVNKGFHVLSLTKAKRTSTTWLELFVSYYVGAILFLAVTA